MPRAIRLLELGNQIAVLYDDDTRDIAYPTQGGLWIVTGSTVESGDFVWPFDPASIDSEWGYRVPPLPGISDFHSGCDWSLGAGTDIPCAGDGVVYQVRNKSTSGSPGGLSWGNRVIVDHGVVDGQQLYSAYAHMQDSGFPHVSVGQSVSAGDTLGYVGQTGSATGDHLHFVTFIGGLAIGNNTNPLNCVNPRSFMADY